MATPEGVNPVILFDDQHQRGRNATERIAVPALGDTLSVPAEQRADPITGQPCILRQRRTYDQGDNL